MRAEGKFSKPTRLEIRARDDNRCVRCGCPATDIHHRRSVRTRDEETASAANGILLCGKGNVRGCHGWVHKNPFEARKGGYVLSPGQTPSAEPLDHVTHGLVILGVEGGWSKREELMS